MQVKFFQKVIVYILTCLQLSRNQQSRCTPYTMNEKIIGSLSEDRAKPLWEIEKESVGLVMHSWFRRCERPAIDASESRFARYGQTCHDAGDAASGTLGKLQIL